METPESPQPLDPVIDVASALPPPFAVITEDLATVEDTVIPGDIRVSPEGRLLRQSIQIRGIASDDIASFNNLVMHTIPARVQAHKITLHDKSTITFAVRIFPPRLSSRRTAVRGELRDLDVEEGYSLLAPIVARNLGISYSGTVFLDVVHRSPQGDILATKNGVDIGKMPIMIGSVLDNLAATSASRRERLEHGECPNIPGGYFIVKNNEWVILHLEKLRVNRVFCYADKDGVLISRMTSSTVRGTNITVVAQTAGVLRVGFPRTLGKKGQGLNIFQVFRILGVPRYQEALALIMLFVEGKERQIRAQLRLTIADFESLGTDDISYIMAERERMEQERERKRPSDGPEEEEEDPRAKYARRVIAELYPHIPVDDIADKTNLFAFHIAKYVRTIIGDLLPDDRNAQGNKRLEGCSIMAAKFGSVFESMTHRAREAVYKTYARGPVTLAAFLQAMGTDLTAAFESAFTVQAWGPFGKREKNGSISEILKTDSLAATLSHLIRISTKVNRRAKKPAIRGVQPTQVGYVDLSDTPEGEPCGLVKNKAVTCWISVDRSENAARAYLQGRVFTAPTPGARTFCLLNGKPMGWCDGRSTESYLRGLKRIYNKTGALDFDTCVILIPQENTLYIHTDGGRATRPLLVVDGEGDLVIDKKEGAWSWTFPRLMAEGCVEYIDALEQEYVVVAQTVADLRRIKTAIPELRAAVESAEIYLKQQPGDPTAESSLESAQAALKRALARKYPQYCELHPAALLGVSGSVGPFPNRNPTPKNTGQCGMARQSAGIYNSAYMQRFDTTARVLTHPTRPLVETYARQPLGMDQAPAGENVILAIATFSGFNVEDSVVINSASVDRGLFRTQYYRTHSLSTNPLSKTDLGTIVEIFRIPTEKRAPAARIYGNIDDDGAPRVGSVLTVEDCIIAKVRIVTPAESTGETIHGREIDESIYVKEGEGGVVDRVMLGQTQNGRRTIKVKVRQVRRPIVGDKIATTQAQKSIIALAVPESDMPFTDSGLIPDVIINPHALPSRMTMSLISEMLGAKFAAVSGERVNGTAFDTFNEDAFLRALREQGYAGDKEPMYDGRTGRLMDAHIMIGPVHYQRLRHFVEDKIMYRGYGPVRWDTRQPIGNRRRGKGLRFGEMEKDALVSHGAPNVVMDRLCLSSDALSVALCAKCGSLAMSDYSARKHVCLICGDKGFVGTCTIPHAYKLLVQTSAGLSLRFSARATEQRPTGAPRQRI